MATSGSHGGPIPAQASSQDEPAPEHLEDEELPCGFHLQPSTKLSEAALYELEKMRYRALTDRETRVLVYSMGGTRIGLPGVGEGQNALTFPLKYEIGDALRAPVWLRFATAEEVALKVEGLIHSKRDGCAYCVYANPVRALTVEGSTKALPHEDYMGLHMRPDGSCCLFALAQLPAEEVEVETQELDEEVEVETQELDEVRPRTPSSLSSRSC